MSEFGETVEDRVIEELARSITATRLDNYRLRREVDRLRKYEMREVNQTREVRRLRSALAAVSWAESLSEAQDAAAAALRGETNEEGHNHRDR